MKPFVAVLVSLACSGLAMAQTSSAPVMTTPDPKAPATKPLPRLELGGNKTTTTKAAKPALPPAAGAKASAAATKAPAAKDPANKAAKKDEPPAKIEGMEIARGAKGFLGLQVVEGNFKLSFYDAKKKAVAPDVIRAVLRWSPKYQKAPEIFVLGPGDGKSLTVAKTVRPPYNFKLFVSMFVEGTEDPVESFVVDFAQ